MTELARRLQQCVAFLGHDSGISHLAAALGLPVLVLWGGAAEHIWRPPHEHAVLIKGEGGLGTISVQQVLRNLTALLNRTGRA